MKIILLSVLLFALANATLYCPSANDFVVGYGNPQIFNQGFTHHGGGGIATKAAFNLIGGSVEYDIDLSKVNTGVNANIYTISPYFSGSFSQGAYCDGQKTGDQWCAEIDWIESNGNCGGQTTLHTRAGPGSTGCTAWGCENSYHYNGKTSFHMKITYGADGTWTTIRDGQTIGPNSLNPAPQSQDWSSLVSQYTQRGAVIYSSLWTGWVPVGDCGSSGDLSSSSFTISNLVISGTVVQGPQPTTCSGSTPSNPPPSNPPSNPPPSPPPSSGGNCGGVSLAFDPSNQYWVEVNAPGNVHLYVVCTNSGTNLYLSCAYNGGLSKWQCNTNGQVCQPDVTSGRYAVVNDQWCRLSQFVAHAIGDEEISTESYEEGFDNVAVENSFDAAVEDSFDAAVEDSYDAAVEDSFDAAVEDSYDAVDSYDENSAFANVDSSQEVTAEPTTQTTQASSNSATFAMIAFVVVFGAFAVVLLVLVVLTSLRLGKL